MIFVTYFNVMTFRTALLPPLLHLLGIDTKNNIQVGSNVLSDEHDEIVLFRNGGFVSPAIYSINDKLYDSKTDLLLDDSQLESAKAITGAFFK
ncbi:hypothetical protein [Sporosarcina newyorkensis]|uniref:hypothetical protein n=1 Tax=Sporosarcina newyorkensis TaxID=759851 RepID=UPI001FEAB0C9|nr:hypothetical protein [Sporosarcina newyorkensis]